MQIGNYTIKTTDSWNFVFLFESQSDKVNSAQSLLSKYKRNLDQLDASNTTRIGVKA